MAAGDEAVADIRRLGDVLLRRGAFERNHGDTLLAARHDAEGLWALELATNAGDEEAAIAMVLAA